ncbi:uncharacterized protein LOC124461640 [Drosophila willistoni]|uniref:uncharacterized protein LOC124461640 n=1 Tax=Drosophila willistoni TaxID=7260 RepID=UPI001F07882D|nr:uncharacterized protein LOC124461640 [Drosophila willistoni]
MRAISIEIVHSLTTNSCLMGLRRHISRRGTPKEIYSDNGTNFRGTDAFLKDKFHLDDAMMHRELSQQEISWYFNPPSAPHMGGAWERLVRSVKTVLYQVEMTVNSRPLTYVSLDDEDQEALTPNHLLLEQIDYKWSFRQSEMFANLFWKRWVKEMLPSITRRSKWHKKVKPIGVGDIVLIVDENQRRNTWTKGRVVELTTAEDGQVRQAKMNNLLASQDEDELDDEVDDEIDDETDNESVATERNVATENNLRNIPHERASENNNDEYRRINEEIE